MSTYDNARFTRPGGVSGGVPLPDRRLGRAAARRRHLGRIPGHEVRFLTNPLGDGRRDLFTPGLRRDRVPHVEALQRRQRLLPLGQPIAGLAVGVRLRGAWLAVGARDQDEGLALTRGALEECTDPPGSVIVSALAWMVSIAGHATWSSAFGPSGAVKAS